MNEAIQMVKERAAMPGKTFDGTQQFPISASSSSSNSLSNDSLLILASKLPLLMKTAASNLFNAVQQQDQQQCNDEFLKLAQKHHLQQQQHQQQQQQQQQQNLHSSSFWNQAVGQQQQKTDIRSVKAIKIDCKSVQKALSNHRQQMQQQNGCDSPPPLGGDQLSNSGFDNGGAFVNNLSQPISQRQQHVLNKINNSNQAARSVPYKFQCPLCSYRTQRQTNFECHVACHENLRIYKCSACAYR